MRASVARVHRRPRAATGAARHARGRRCVHGGRPRREQTALIRAFEYCLPGRARSPGAHPGRAGSRLREGAEPRRIAATILRGSALHPAALRGSSAGDAGGRRRPSARSTHDLLHYGRGERGADHRPVGHRGPPPLPAARPPTPPGTRARSSCWTPRCGSCRSPSSPAAPPGGPGSTSIRCGAPAGDRLRGRARGQRALLAWIGAPRARSRRWPRRAGSASAVSTPPGRRLALRDLPRATTATPTRG